MLDRDLDAMLARYAPDAVFASPAADFVAGVRMTVASDDLAMLYSPWRIGRPRVASGFAVDVLRRQPDGRWLLAIGEPRGVGQG